MSARIASQSAVRGVRNFSALSKTRAAIRSMEPHPFQRPVTTMESAKADWGKQFKKAAITTSFFLPTIGLFLSWPVLTGIDISVLTTKGRHPAHHNMAPTPSSA